MLVISSDQVVYAMSPNNVAVATVASGTEVQFNTCDCFNDQVENATTEFGTLDWSRINPATGPVFVEDACVGDVLKVEILAIELNNQAVMMTAPKLGIAGALLEDASIHIVPIKEGQAHLPGGVIWPLNPMIGVIGTAPKDRDIPCGEPDAHGGNMDCKIIKQGTELYLPVNVPGALFALGDLHAAMGDGEVSVCGLEIKGQVQVRLSVIKNTFIPTPFAVNPEAMYAIASAKLLDDAAQMASENMLKFICDRTSLNTSEAVSLMSACGDLQICQVVDPQKTCRFALPSALCQQLNIRI